MNQTFSALKRAVILIFSRKRTCFYPMNHKQIIRVMISTVLVCSVLATSAMAAKVTATKNTNVHTKASSSSNILTAMKKGSSANTIRISNSGKWAKLSVNGETGYVKLSSLKLEEYSFDLQTNYPTKAYTTSSGQPSGATISSGGCCPTTVGNILRNLCWISDATTENVCALATASGARYNGGTSPGSLLKAAKAKWGGFTYSYTESYSKMKKHIKNGGMAVAHTPGASSGAGALFSNGGHFVAVVDTSGSNLIVVDPYWFDGKWTANSVRVNNVSLTGTKGKVLIKNDAVDNACDYYYLVSKK